MMMSTDQNRQHSRKYFQDGFTGIRCGVSYIMYLSFNSCYWLPLCRAQKPDGCLTQCPMMVSGMGPVAEIKTTWENCFFFLCLIQRCGFHYQYWRFDCACGTQVLSFAHGEEQIEIDSRSSFFFHKYDPVVICLINSIKIFHQFTIF